MKTQCDGVVAFHVSIRVSIEEMRTWEPRRIYSFFEGLAKTIEARGLPPVAAAPATDTAAATEEQSQ